MALAFQPPVHVEVRHSPGGVAVYLSGELDYWTRPKVLEELDEAVWSSRPASLVVDVTELRFVDSRGLGALIDGTAAARRHGADVVISGAGPMLRRLVDTLRLRHLLTLNDGAIAA
jgi:anti-anti-sigma factor